MSVDGATEPPKPQPARQLRPQRRSISAWLFALVMLLAIPNAWARFDGPADVARDLDSAEVQTPDGRWQPQPLPLRWRAGQADQVRLRFDLELDRPPDAMWALRFERLPPDHDLLINGQRVHGQPVGSGRALPRSVISQWIDLPPSLLHAGSNRIDLSVALYGNPGGVSAPRIGPAADLMPSHRVARLWRETLPYALNMATSGLALFMLLAWWLRRSERLMGLFGALMLMVALRNMGYYTDDGMLPTPVGSLLYFWAIVLTTTLINGLAIALDEPRQRRRRTAWLLGGTAIGLALAVAAALAGRLAVLRSFGYPLLMLLMLGGLWRLRRIAARTSPAFGRQMTAATLLIVAFSIHDYLFLAGRLALDDGFWLPYLTPVLMSAAALALLQRFVQALAMSERQALELERRVAERTRDLELANAAKTRFVAAASHDLRQPVASIGLLTSLMREPMGEADSRLMLDRLGASVTALENLLKGLLDLSRLDASATVAKLTTVPLQPLFDAVAAHETETAFGKDLSLRCRAGDLAVRADPVLLEQIIRNLVNNAVRYTQRGGVLLCARRVGRGQVLIQVWDTGSGIAAEQQQAVFEEFVQLGKVTGDQAPGQPAGLGLGLSLVQRAAQRLGTSVGLRSVPGRGSCFSLRLPAVDTAAAPDPPPPQQVSSLPAGPLRRTSVVVQQTHPGGDQQGLGS
jgi:signal transduction histidine kinase